MDAINVALFLLLAVMYHRKGNYLYKQQNAGKLAFGGEIKCTWQEAKIDMNLINSKIS
jgi:hypothetical protein